MGHMFKADCLEEFRLWGQKIRLASVFGLKMQMDQLRKRIVSLTQEDPFPVAYDIVKLSYKRLLSEERQIIKTKPFKLDVPPDTVNKTAKSKKSPAELFPEQKGKSSFLSWETFE